MSKIGKYIYGVINSDTEEFFDMDQIVAFEDIHPLKNPTKVINSNKAPNQAYTICFQDTAAVVSDSEIVDCSHMPKDTLGRLLVGHQQLVEKVMAKYTIIPMRLGTFAQSDEEVKGILASGYRTIKDIFGRAKDMVEIDVAATLSDFNSFMQEVSEEEEIKQLKQSLLGKKGGVTIDDQMRVGVLVKRHLDKKKEILANQIQTALGEITQNLKAHDLMDDKMVLNTAFLLDKNRQKEFEHKLDEINDKFEDKLNFRCVGPLPPYSFYTLEVKKPQFEEIDWARKELGLTDDFITATEIKKAHRRVALTCHPDKNPNTPGIEQKFNEMTKAYKILLDYYRASNQDEHDEGCYLNEQAFEKNALLVTTMA
ncbi:GvpL/GvpF family gas vesicle protein [bacterium]|nr:GvpL/GvpF family gas vesicle protein [Planctomycetota bacterium]MBU1517968.1 GvpL/GvpF family gas vesicle protein [Planctomycetota bacterium]MBU2461767.1 GvpL/GvpF family gas vesicle protein [bacterium]